MEIKFAEPPASAPTFEDVAVGQVFNWLPADQYGARLKISESAVFILEMNVTSEVAGSILQRRVSDVATIESITLRRVK